MKNNVLKKFNLRTKTLALFMLLLCLSLESLLAQASGEVTVLKFDENNVPLDSITQQYLSKESKGGVGASHGLEDVVVVAYGRSRKRDLTGAISSITARDIEGLSVSNLLGALEGTTGVLIQNNNGQVGQEGFVFVRGFTSANGTNEPLFVVDGAEFYGSLNDLNPEDIESISVLKDAAALALYGARAANGVVLIAMKTGRSGKFIFGESGAVRVSIKQGIYTRGMKDYSRLNATDWSYWQFQGLVNSHVSNGMSLPEAQRLAQQTLVRNYFGYNVYNVSPDQVFQSDGNLKSGVKMKSQYAEDRDWEKALMQVGYRQEYDISASHLKDNVNSYISLGYLNETGYVKETDYRRLTGRGNVAYRGIKNLEVAMSLDISYQTSQVMRQTQDNPSNIIAFMRHVGPIYPIHQHDEETGDYILDKQGNRQFDASDTRPYMSRRNPIWELSDLENHYQRVSIIARPSISYTFPYGFVLNSFATYTNFNEQTRNNHGSQVGEWKGIGMTEHISELVMSRFWSQNLKWKRRFGDHEFTALVAHENQQQTYGIDYVSAKKQLAEGNDDYINFAYTQGIDGYSTLLRTESFLARILVNYGNRYYLELCGRRDGSSRFAKSGRWGNFGAIGFSYVMSDEEWYQLSQCANVLSEAKFRINFGNVGNDRSASLVSSQNLYRLSSISTSSATFRSQLGNPNLKWESASTFNAGMDLKFKNRAQISLDAYIKRSNDLIFGDPLPLSAGLMDSEVYYASPTRTINLGSVRNAGYELTANADVVRNKSFRWNLGINLTQSVSRVVDMPENAKKNGIINNNGQIIAMNEPLYTWYLPEYIGVNTQNGRALYSFNDQIYQVVNGPQQKTGSDTRFVVDASNDPDLVNIDGVWYSQNRNKGYTKRVKCGSVLPKIYGSISNRIHWREFSLGALLNFSFGGKVLDDSYRQLLIANGTDMTALHSDIKKSWQYGMFPDGDAPRVATDILPAVNYSHSNEDNALSTRFLTSASYLAVRRVQLTYDVPDRILSSLNIRQMSIHLSGENLLTISARRGMDPNQGLSATGLSGVIGDSSSSLRLFSLGLSFKL